MRIVIVLLVLAATPAFAGVRHLPPAEAPAGAPLELVASVPPPAPVLQAHYRTIGDTAFTAVELVRRDDEHWVAVVPAAAVTAPGVEYYLDAAGAPVFASAAAPHRTRVSVTESAERRAHDELRTHGRRYRIHSSGEWVDYGTKTVDATPLVDRYYRVDADVSYQLWAYPLDAIRVGYTRLVGDTQAPMCNGATVCTKEAGFKVAGWFKLGLAPVEGIGVDGRLIVLATQTGFAVGGRGELRVGQRDATHVAAGLEYIADVGTSGFVRLGWATIPRTPMAATVEVTTLPAQTRDVGVRLYVDIARQLLDNFRLGVRAGYAAREQSIPGFTGGATASVDF